MKLPFKFATRKMQTVREYDWCEKHGDLRAVFPNSAVHVLYQDNNLREILSSEICPHCFNEWLKERFPVERRTDPPEAPA